MTFQNIWLESWIHDLHGNLPPALASLIIYVVAFCICFFLYHVTKRIVPKMLQLYTADFFKTLVICTYPYGHGLIRVHHGHVGYCIAAVPLIVFTLMTFKEGCGSPLNVFRDFLDKKSSTLVMLFRIAVQIVAGFASYRLANMVWLLEMHPSHVMKLQEDECITDLTVPVATGFLIEMGGVLLETLVSFLPLSKNALLDLTMKVLSGALLVCAGVHMTGMYMHPVMASGMSFWCSGTSTLEHVFVYWAGGFLGCYVAVVIHRLTTSAGLMKRKKVGDVTDGDHRAEKTKTKLTDNNRNKIIPEKNGNYGKTESSARQRKT